MELFYLVGQISPKFPESYDWRNWMEEEFANEPAINFINPCINLSFSIYHFLLFFKN